MARWICRNYLKGAILIEIVAGIALIPYLIQQDMSFPYYLLTTAFCLMVALAPWVILMSVCTQKVNRTVVRSLDEDCDPDPLLDHSRQMLRQYDKKDRRRGAAVLFYRLNEATALLCLGRFDEALDCMDRLEPKLPAKPTLATLTYWNNRSALCFDLGKREEMAQDLDRTEQLLAQVHLSPSQRVMYQFSLRINRCTQRFLEDGPTEAAEREYQYLLDHAANQRQRVSFHSALGQCAMARGAFDEAREHLSFAVQHGGKLYTKRRAEELLGGLEAHR